MKKIVVIGCMDNTLDNTFESANRVYDRKYTCPTIPTCGGGGIQPKVIKNVENIRKSGSGGGSEEEW